MKKILSAILILAAVLTCASCSRKSYLNEHAPDTTRATGVRSGFEDVTVPENVTATPETDPASGRRDAALAAAKAFLGETDEESGLKYTFSYDGTEYFDGTEYTKIRVSLHDGDGAYTLCGYLLVDGHGNVTKYEW